MSALGFVWLAYCIVWFVLLLYLLSLKSRLRKAETKLSELRVARRADSRG